VVVPPNTFTVGAVSFTSDSRNGQGHAAVHAAVSNNTVGELQIFQAWRADGPFVLTHKVTTALEAVSGLHTAEIIAPVSRRFVRVTFIPAAAPPGLGAAFEIGFYFEPRADSGSEAIAGGAAVDIIPDQVTVIGNKQIQTVEALPLLASSASFDGGEKDNIDFEAMSVSLTVSSTLGTTINVKFQQRASGADTFRDTDVIAVAVPAGGAPGPLVNFDRVWSISRRFGRIRVENTGANVLVTAECIVVQKAIS
jgi:hypothetical protein